MLTFTNRNTGTLRAASSAGGFISMPGVNPDDNSPTNLVNQVNKVLAIGGKSVVADTQMTVDRKKGVVEDE